MIEITLNEVLGKKRMKMSELSELSGVNKNSILSLYHNRSRRIDLDVMEKLCKALDCDLTELLRYTKD